MSADRLDRDSPVPYLDGMLAIREYRERAGVSQDALAETAGLSVRTVRRIERDSDYDPGVSTAARVAAALGVTVDDLLHNGMVAPHTRAVDNSAKPRQGHQPESQRPRLKPKGMVAR